MKLLEFTSAPAPDVLPGLMIATDSSIGLAGRPVFLPEWGEAWRCRVMPVFRIGRLGKTISKRFASRYIDGVSLAARFVPSRTTFSVPVDSAWLSAFDSALSVGSFMPLNLTDASDKKNFVFEATLANGDCHRKTAAYESALDAVSSASNLFTLKNGDLIIPFTETIELDISPDMRLQAGIDGVEVMNFKIK